MDTNLENPSPSDNVSSAQASHPGGTNSPWPRWFVGIMVVLTLAVVITRYSLKASIPEPTGPLPIVAPVPEFSLTERSGRQVTTGDLRGTVWLANFIFTTCAGPCPELTLRARSLQESLRKYGPGVKIVTFTVDPEHDTPKVLSRYATEYHADPERWWFLTTDKDATMQALIEHGFLQTVLPEDHEGPIIHSTYFVLVDREGRLRGFYDGLDAASKPRIMRDVKSLLDEVQGSDS